MTKEPGTEKKAWQKPELIVLARSNPEEAVLTTCKGNSIVSAAGTHNRKCIQGRNLCIVDGPS